MLEALLLEVSNKKLQETKINTCTKISIVGDLNLLKKGFQLVF